VLSAPTLDSNVSRQPAGVLVLLAQLAAALVEVARLPRAAAAYAGRMKKQARLATRGGVLKRGVPMTPPPAPDAIVEETSEATTNGVEPPKVNSSWDDSNDPADGDAKEPVRSEENTGVPVAAPVRNTVDADRAPDIALRQPASNVELVEAAAEWKRMDAEFGPFTTGFDDTDAETDLTLRREYREVDERFGL